MFEKLQLFFDASFSLTLTLLSGDRGRAVHVFVPHIRLDHAGIEGARRQHPHPTAQGIREVRTSLPGYAQRFAFHVRTYPACSIAELAAKLDPTTNLKSYVEVNVWDGVCVMNFARDNEIIHSRKLAWFLSRSSATRRAA